MCYCLIISSTRRVNRRLRFMKKLCSDIKTTLQNHIPSDILEDKTKQSIDVSARTDYRPSIKNGIWILIDPKIPNTSSINILLFICPIWGKFLIDKRLKKIVPVLCGYTQQTNWVMCESYWLTLDILNSCLTISLIYSNNTNKWRRMA